METWYDKALCADVDVDFFSEDPLETHMAKSICSQCPVRRQCLEYALDTQTRFGIWGGVSEKVLRKSLGIDQFGKPVRKGKTVVCPNCGGKDLAYSQKERTKLKFTCNECDLSWWSRRTAKVVEVDIDDEDLEGTFSTSIAE